MPTPEESLAHLYRRSVRESIRQYQSQPGVDPDQHFRDYLTATYAAYRRHLSTPQALARSGMPVHAVKVGLFILSVGLFAYGEVDKAADVVEYLPAEGGIRKLALALPALLPLPAEYDVLAAPEGVREWLERYGPRLRWREAEARYELRDG